ncbi:MAG: hypothetical protein NTZ05_02210, partial [Chloroflexi bacterium]|nr:hypothetical protein [Chloroflexota bacterium]
MLDEKSWSGPITGNEEYWFRSGRPERSPLKKIDMGAKVLAGNLRSRNFELDQVRDHFVEGAILLTRAEASPVILGDPRVTRRVLLLREVVAQLRQWDADPAAGNEQAGIQRERIRELLTGWPARPKFPAAINRFSLEERPVERHGIYRALATNEFGQRRLLTLYPLHDNDPDLRRFYQRQTDALVALQGTGLAPDMGDTSEWGDYLVTPSSVPEGAPLASLPRPQSAAGARHELARAAAAFRSLAGLHERGVIHRALGPEAIYLTELGSDVRVMFTGFHAARLSDRTIAARLDGLG